MLLRNHKAREWGAYLLMIAVPLPSCFELVTNLVNVPLTRQVQHRVHDARRYLRNAVPFPDIWQRLTDVLRCRCGCESGK